MQVSKAICKLLKEKFREFQKTGTDYEEWLEIVEKTMPGGFDGFLLNPREYNRDEEGVVRELAAREKKSTERLQAKVQTLIDNLSIEGFKGVTYGLPFYCFTCYGLELDYTYALLTGIKMNAKDKSSSDELMDEVEKRLYELEEQMAEYIDDKYKIEIGDAEKFLSLYKQYLDFYYEHVDYDLDERFDYDVVFHSLMAKMALYLSFVNLGSVYSESGYGHFMNLYFKTMDDGKDSVEALVVILNRLAKYEKEKESMSASIRETIDKGCEPFKVSKKASNKLRGNLKATINANVECEKAVDELIELVRTGKFNTLSEEEQIAKFAKLKNVNFTSASSIEDLIGQLEFYKKAYTNTAEIFRGLVAAISVDGMKKTTYSLPIVALFDKDDEFNYVYLIVTGIVRNVANREKEGLVEESFEAGLYEREKRLAPYIDEDYRLDKTFITEFVNLFMEDYIYHYFTKANLIKDASYNYKEMQENILLGLILYLIYTHLGVRFEKDGRDAIRRYMESLIDKEEITFGGVARFTFEYVAREYELQSRKMKWTVVKEEAPKASEDNTLCELGKYIQNGVVVEPCEDEAFEALLEGAGLSDNRIFEYKAQMKNLKARLARQEYARRMELCKESVFSSEERELYDKWKENPVCAKEIASIDSILELFMEASDEDRMLLLDELPDCFEALLEIANGILMDDAKTSEQDKIVYYPVDVVMQDGSEAKIPRLLKSILEDKKCNRKQAWTELEKLRTGNTFGDREEYVKSGLSKIWCKGRGMRVYYTKVGGVVLVVDGGMDGGAFKRTLKTIETADFASFVDQLKADIVAGTMEAWKDYTPLVRETLANKGKIKIKK